MSQYDISKPESLDLLEKHLSTNLFIGGALPNAQDALTSELFGQNAPCAEKYPATAGWFYNMHYFLPHIKESWKAVEEKKKSPKKEAKKPSPKKEAPKKNDDDDLFEDDEEENEDEKKARQERMKKALEEKKKKDAEKAAQGKKKEEVIAKSLIILDVKVFEMEQDLEALAVKVKALKFDGLVWKEQHKIAEIAFGMKKLVLGMVVEDEKVSVDDVIEQITAFEDEVQSVDIVSFDKI